jgi:alpha-2-macroglobulin
MKAEYTPNVYVSAMVVRGRISQNQATAVIDPGKPAYQIGLSSINVNRAPNTLKVAIRTLDKNGAATTKFKPRQTVKAEVTISKWAPRGQTPAANAEFALAVIDKGLLQLSKNNTWNLLDAMLGSRELEVETATAQMQVIGKRHYGVKAKPTGGDGALMGQSRELFDTRLTWVGRVVTDAAGKATVEFQTNDSPTEFVIVAIANQGADKFGQGEASIVSQPDIMVLPAIGTVVRDGDVFAQEFTLRNTTEAQQKLSVSGQVTFTLKDGKTQVVAVPAQSAEIGPRGDVMMNLGNVTVPDGAVKSQVVYTVTNGAGQKVDEIKLTQEVKPSVIPRVWAAQLNQMTSPVNFTSFIPNDVKPGESLIKVQMLPSLAAGLESVKDDFASYPYQSLELIASRAAATANQELWNDAMRRLPAHLDSNGLVMFFPGSSGRGSDALTAYIMSIANYSGMEIPEESLERMISGLTAIVEGRKAVAVAGETQVIAYIRRVNAIEVLNRYGRAQAEWLTALPAIENSQVPTTTLVDLLSIYANMEVEGGAQKLEEVTARLQARMTRTRTEMKFTAQAPRYWFMLTSADAEQLDLINVISRNDYLAAQWSADAALLIQGAANMMKAGSWDLTVANAIGVLAFKAFAAQFEAGTVTGDTAISIGTRVAATWNWNAKPEGGVLASPTQPGNVAVNLTHTGTGAPWAITSVIYAQPLTQKKESHISVTKTVTPQKAVYKKGDVVTITLKIQPQTDMPMVSIMDPIPAGAKILGTGLDNDREQGAVIQQGWAWPDYEAKTYDAYNLSFYEIPAGGVTVAYKVQLNNAGTFKLPATRVEAIYAPENFAEVPNAPVSIQPK